jgi:hypothetical protein
MQRARRPILQQVKRVGAAKRVGQSVRALCSPVVLDEEKSGRANLINLGTEHSLHLDKPLTTGYVGLRYSTRQLSRTRDWCDRYVATTVTLVDAVIAEHSALAGMRAAVTLTTARCHLKNFSLTMLCAIPDSLHDMVQRRLLLLSLDLGFVF